MLWQWLWDKHDSDGGNAWWLDAITSFWLAVGLGALCVIGYAVYHAISVFLSVIVPI